MLSQFASAVRTISAMGAAGNTSLAPRACAYSNMGVQTLLGRELAFLLFTTFGVLLLLWSFYDLSKAGDKRGVIAIGFPMSILILAIMADAWLELGVLH